jgi:hypothetical protein
MNDSITDHADNLVSAIVALWALVVAWLEPSKFLILATIVLTLVKLAHSIILLRRDLRSGGNGG